MEETGVDPNGLGVEISKKCKAIGFFAANFPLDLGGGELEIALCCDLIIFSENATFAFPEIRSGTVADAAFIKLPKRILYHVAMDLLLKGRWFDAPEAKSYSLIEEIVNFDQLRKMAWELAVLLASGPPLVYPAIKEIVRDAEDENYQDTLNRITKGQFKTVDQLYSSEDQIEGAKAFAEKRSPK